MGHFVEGADRDQASFLPARLEDYVAPDNPVRVIDAFVDELDLAGLGFERVQPAATGRPGYAPGTMLKLYAYCYLHQLTSSRKLARRKAHIEQSIARYLAELKEADSAETGPGDAAHRAPDRTIGLAAWAAG